MLEEVRRMKQLIENSIKTYKFGDALIKLRTSLWHVFADWYIENVKSRLYQPVSASDKKAAQFTLYTCLREYLKMLHPFIPFITDRIWQEVPKKTGDHKTLMYTPWNSN